MATFESYDQLYADPDYQSFTPEEKTAAERGLSMEFEAEGEGFYDILRAKTVGNMRNAGFEDEQIQGFTDLRKQIADGGDLTALDPLIENGQIGAFRTYNDAITSIEEAEGKAWDAQVAIPVEGRRDPLVRVRSLPAFQDHNPEFDLIGPNGEVKRVITGPDGLTNKDFDSFLTDLRPEYADDSDPIRGDYAQAIDEQLGAEGGAVRALGGALVRGAASTATGLGGLMEATGAPGIDAIGEKIRRIGELGDFDRTRLEAEEPAVGAAGTVASALGQLSTQFAAAGAASLGNLNKIGQLGAFTATGAGAASGNAYLDSMAEKGDVGKARDEAASVFFTTALLEWGAGRYFGKLAEGQKSIIRRALAGGGVEAGTEVFQTAAELLANQYFRDNNIATESVQNLVNDLTALKDGAPLKETLNSLNENPFVAAVIGGLGAGGAVGAAGAAPGGTARGATPDATPEVTPQVDETTEATPAQQEQLDEVEAFLEQTDLNPEVRAAAESERDNLLAALNEGAAQVETQAEPVQTSAVVTPEQQQAEDELAPQGTLTVDQIDRSLDFMESRVAQIDATFANLDEDAKFDADIKREELLDEINALQIERVRRQNFEGNLAPVIDNNLRMEAIRQERAAALDYQDAFDNQRATDVAPPSRTVAEMDAELAELGQQAQRNLPANPRGLDPLPQDPVEALTQAVGEAVEGLPQQDLQALIDTETGGDPQETVTTAISNAVTARRQSGLIGREPISSLIKEVMRSLRKSLGSAVNGMRDSIANAVYKVMERLGHINYAVPSDDAGISGVFPGLSDEAVTQVAEVALTGKAFGIDKADFGQWLTDMIGEDVTGYGGDIHAHMEKWGSFNLEPLVAEALAKVRGIADGRTNVEANQLPADQRAPADGGEVSTPPGGPQENLESTAKSAAIDVLNDEDARANEFQRLNPAEARTLFLKETSRGFIDKNAPRGNDPNHPNPVVDDYAWAMDREHRLEAFLNMGLKPIQMPNRMRDEYLNGGVESDVYVDASRERVFKFFDSTQPASRGLISYQMQQAELMNRMFGDDQRLEGFDMDKMMPVWSQPFRKGRRPTDTELESTLIAAGFDPISMTYLSQDGLWMIFDAHPGNWIAQDGQIYPIDIHARFALEMDANASRGLRMDGIDVAEALTVEGAQSALTYLDATDERLGRPSTPFEFPIPKQETVGDITGVLPFIALVEPGQPAFDPGSLDNRSFSTNLDPNRSGEAGMLNLDVVADVAMRLYGMVGSATEFADAMAQRFGDFMGEPAEEIWIAIDTGGEDAMHEVILANFAAPEDTVDDGTAGDTLPAADPSFSSEERELSERGRGGVGRDSGWVPPPGSPYPPATRPALRDLADTVRVNGERVTFGPFEPARQAAEAYAATVDFTSEPPQAYVKVDKERATRIANDFEAMPHNPEDPAVVESYKAMAEETKAQYQVVKDTGLEIEAMPPGPDLYGNPRNAILDVVENNHFYFFPTDNGFGGGQDIDTEGNPMLEESGEFLADGTPLLYNDLFRIVHDYFGHIKEGVGFRADGEENAWRQHVAMYSPAARPAMSNETRGQNSWVNFGPHGEHNRTATSDTIFGPQKLGILPDYVYSEGLADPPLEGDTTTDATGRTDQTEGVASPPEAAGQSAASGDGEVVGSYSAGEVAFGSGAKRRIVNDLGDGEFVHFTKADTPELTFVGVQPAGQGEERLSADLFPDDYVPRSYWGGNGYMVEEQYGLDADRGHKVTIPPELIYDREADPLDVRRRSREEMEKRGMDDMKLQSEIAMRMIRDGGYAGFRITAPGNPTTGPIEAFIGLVDIPTDGSPPQVTPTVSPQRQIEFITGRSVEINGVTFDNIHERFSGYQIALVPADAVEEHGADMIGEGPEYENQIGNRIGQFKEFLADGNRIEVPEVYVNADGAIIFGNGRHRTRVLLEEGFGQIPMAMQSESLRNLNKVLGQPVGINDIDEVLAGAAVVGTNAPPPEEEEVSAVDPVNDTERVGTSKLGSKRKPRPTGPDSNIATENVPEKVIKKQVDQITGEEYSHVPKSIRDEKNPERKAKRYIKWMKENLLALYDAVDPSVVVRSSRWYDGARVIADDIAERYDLMPRQVAAVMAALSPQKDWFMNVAQAEQLIDIWKNHQFTPIEGAAVEREMQAIIDSADNPAEKGRRKKIFESMKGKNYAQLDSKPYTQGWAVRVMAQALYGRSYSEISPEGVPGAAITKKDGQNKANGWGAIGEIIKSVNVLNDGSLENISNNIGEMHKVRSFYNNIIAPNSPEGDITADTHAVAAAHLMPFGSGSLPVTHNFSGAGSPTNGINGHYHLFAEAYRQAAEDRNLQPRQMQSITWEAVRSLWSPEFRRDDESVDSVRNTWKRNSNVQARNSILQHGILPPIWARSRNDVQPAPVPQTDGGGAGDQNDAGANLRFRGGIERRDTGGVNEGQLSDAELETFRTTLDARLAKQAGAINFDLFADAAKALWRQGVGLAEFASNMTKQLGQKVGELATALWNHLAARQTTPQPPATGQATAPSDQATAPAETADVRTEETDTTVNKTAQPAGKTPDQLFREQLLDFRKKRAAAKDKEVGDFAQRVILDPRLEQGAVAQVVDEFGPITDNTVLTAAKNYVQTNGVEATADQVISGTVPVGVENLEATAVAQEAMLQLNELIIREQKDVEKDRMRIKFGDLAAAEGVNRRDQARALRYTSIEGKLDAATLRIAAEKVVATANKAAKKANPNADTKELSDEQKEKLQKIGEKTQELRDAGKLNKLEEQIQAAKVAEIVADSIPPGFWEKVRMTQTIAMLLNPKTAIRNIVGNTIFSIASTASEYTAIPFDLGISIVSGNKRSRTVTGVTKGMAAKLKAIGYPVQVFKSGQALSQETGKLALIGAGIDAIIATSRSNSRGKWGIEDINRANSVFSSRWAKAFEKALGLTLGTFDLIAFQGAYQNSVAQQLDATGLEMMTDEMIEVAQAEALAAIFQDDTKLGKILEGTKQSLNTIGDEITGGKFGFGDLLLKFTRTPASIFMKGLGFTPAGLVTAGFAHISKTGRTLDQRGLTEVLGRSATGTLGFIMMGAWMQTMGLIVHSDDDDPDKRQLDKQRGLFGRQVNFSALKRMLLSMDFTTPQELLSNDVLGSYDWALPASLPMAMGAEMSAGSSWGEGFAKGIQTLEEEPMLKGLTHAVMDGVAAQRDDKSFFQAIGTGLLTDAAASMMPSFLSQINRAFIDPVQRDAFSSESQIQQAIDGVKNKLPFLSKTLPPKPDTLGGDLARFEGYFPSWVMMINPMIDTQFKGDPILDEMNTIYEQTSDVSIFPTKVQKSISIRPLGAEKNEQHRLSPQEKAQLQQWLGQLTQKTYEELVMNDADFALEEPEVKAEIMADAISDIYTAGKVLVLGHRPTKLSKEAAWMVEDAIEATPDAYSTELKEWIKG